jgi:hypothetical protein
MAGLTRVHGFYYKYGSRDVPFNYSPDKPFGFNSAEIGQDELVPIFKYSINDVERAIIECRTIVKRSAYDSKKDTDKEGGVCTLLVDSSAETGDPELRKVDTSTGSIWDKVFNVLEYLGQNQSSISNAASPGTDFTSNGDQFLGSTIIPGGTEENPYYCSIYRKNSLAFTLSTKPDRIASVQFTVSGALDPGNIGEITGIQGDVRFTIYLDADAFVERSENVGYKVYRYEDIAPTDDTISASEFDSQIVKRLFNILATGKYKQYSKMFITKHYADVKNDDENKKMTMIRIRSVVGKIQPILMVQIGQCFFG